MVVDCWWDMMLLVMVCIVMSGFRMRASAWVCDVGLLFVLSLGCAVALVVVSYC